jgi:hypothetical protein
MRVTSHDAHLTAYVHYSTDIFHSVDQRLPQDEKTIFESAVFPLFRGRHGFCIGVKVVNPREKPVHSSRHRDDVSSRMLCDIFNETDDSCREFHKRQVLAEHDF